MNIWTYKRGKAFGVLSFNGEPQLRDDFDTNPPVARIEKVWAWVCKVLNNEPSGDPEMLGRFRFNNGYLCSGSMRVAAIPYGETWDEYSDVRRARVDDACERLNAAIHSFDKRQASTPAPQ